MKPLPRLFATLVVSGLFASGCHRVDSTVGKPASMPSISSVPPGFALIPAGEFIMGDALDEDQAAPSHKVAVSAFYMQQKDRNHWVSSILPDRKE
jgi:formylglycine-generating enzyme required for sulfatase activity